MMRLARLLAALFLGLALVASPSLGSVAVFGFKIPVQSGAHVTKVIFLTSGTSVTVPSDWNSANNTIECIGPGGNGFTGANLAGGGGAGGYASKNNLALTAGASITYQVGLGGSTNDTFFDSTAIVKAAHGVTATSATGGAGGSSNVGDTTFSGGAGGTAGGSFSSGGGGGSAGPSGAGKNGGSGTAGGAGGGGSNGGSSSAGSAAIGGNPGGAGGNGNGGTGGGLGGTSSVAATVGTNGGGGGGGSTVVPNGANGGQQTIWTATTGGATAGPGGGGGGGVTTHVGGNGGGFGGGGGGVDGVPTTGALGAPGIIVITYTT